MVAWSVPRRIVFRFATAFALLLIYPFPLGMIPGTRWIADALNVPWEVGVAWFARAVLDIPAPSNVPTGSGDTTWIFVQLLMIAILATLATLAWSALDRKRLAYPRLAAGMVVLLRYYLAFMMLLYGLVKLVKVQFPDLSPIRLDGRIGDMSPMGLLWAFMGHSTAYTVFAGLAEMLGGVLLLWRRTATAGALVSAAVLANIVMLNLCYDVPVKLFSIQLLIMALVIAGPGLRRVVLAVLGRAVAEVPPRTRATPRQERVRFGAKLAMLAAYGLVMVGLVEMGREARTPHHELYGIWVVDTFAIDGVERPPLITDGERWRKLAAGDHGVAIRLVTDDRLVYLARFDERRHTIRVAITPITSATLDYTLRDTDHLVLDGMWGTHFLHITLTREPDPLLVTRGFHWIQDRPFHH